MTVGVASRYRPIVIGLMVMSLAGEMLLPVIPQDQNYHDFADQRTLLGMRNVGT
jgi:hypothetical protein